MGIINKWNKNLFESQMNKLNEQARVCVNTAINGPEHSVNTINSLKNFAPIFFIFLNTNVLSFVIFLLEHIIWKKYK